MSIVTGTGTFKGTGGIQLPPTYPFTNSPLYDELQAEGTTKFSGEIHSVTTFMSYEQNLSRRPYVRGRLTRPDLLEQCAINAKLEEYRQYVLDWLNNLF